MALTRDLRAATFAIGVGVVMLAGNAQAQPDRYDALANSAMTENRPTRRRRSCCATSYGSSARPTYLWALPLINTLGMKGLRCPTAGSFFRAATRSPRIPRSASKGGMGTSTSRTSCPMDQRAMAGVAAAITIGRLAPAGERLARAIATVVLGPGLV
jgi:hypothetical protein